VAVLQTCASPEACPSRQCSKAARRRQAPWHSSQRRWCRLPVCVPVGELAGGGPRHGAAFHQAGRVRGKGPTSRKDPAEDTDVTDVGQVGPVRRVEAFENHNGAAEEQ